MDRNILLRTHHDRWQRQPNVAAPLRQWLTDHRSLTARLKRQYDTFAVALLSVKLAVPNQDELAMLSMRAKQLAHIREVLLLGNGEPLVFAHTAISMSSVQRGWAGFLQQGSKPLGETLFSDPTIKRSRLSYKRIQPNHPLHQAMQGGLRAQGYPLQNKALWARRSLFSTSRAVTGECRQSMEMLVTEVFLSELGER